MRICLAAVVACLLSGGLRAQDEAPRIDPQLEKLPAALRQQGLALLQQTDARNLTTTVQALMKDPPSSAASATPPTSPESNCAAQRP